MTNSDKLTFEDIIALYNQYTSYGADIPMQHDAYSKLCAAMPQAVGMLREYRDMLVAVLLDLNKIGTRDHIDDRVKHQLVTRLEQLLQEGEG